MKTLTISVAAYNVEAYIEDCLGSIVAAEGTEEVEVLVVDDGSTDRTGELAERYVREYPAIFSLIRKENGGYGSTINRALDRMQGTYYMVLDGDDSLDPVDLGHLIRGLKSSDQDIIFFDVMNCYPGKSRRDAYFTGLEPEREYSLDQREVFQNPFGLHHICVHRRVLEGGKIHLLDHCFYTDTQFLMGVLTGARTCKYRDLSPYRYRLGRAGQSVELASYQRNVDQLLRVCKRVVEDYEGADHHSPLQREGIGLLIRRKILEASFSVLLSLPNGKERLRSFDEDLRGLSESLYWEAEKRWLIKITRRTSYLLVPAMRYLYLAYRRLWG